jgi:signal transduction histidine kinase
MAQSKSIQFAEIDQLNDSCKSNWFSNTNLAIEIGTYSSELALETGYGEGLATAYNNLGVAFWVRGELDRALRLYYQSINIRDTIGGELGLANTYHNIGNVFKDRQEYVDSKRWFKKALAIRNKINDSLGISYSINNLGLIAQKEGKYDSADFFLTKSLKIRESLNNTRGIATSHMSLGKLRIELKDYKKAEEFFFLALSDWISIEHFQGQADTYIELAKLSRIMGDYSKLQKFISRGIEVALPIQAKPQLLQLYKISADAYLQMNDTISAFEQLQNAYFYSIDIYDQQKEDLIQQYNLDQAAYSNELLQKENLLQKQQIQNQKNRERTIGIIILFLIILVFLMYRILRIRAKSNKILKERNDELGRALEELKKTQSQLVQSEKMASLGTLTAGVSHEINNPLNFVMGAYELLFSHFRENKEVDKEVIDSSLNSLKMGIDRISKIVRGLNQFSRNNDNMNESCDIHLIMENCLEMFNNQLKKRISVKKHYYKTPLVTKGNVGKLHQVFLNILANAIQAIPEKGTIEVITKLFEDTIIVEIKDDGVGISEDHIKQITDPFFTTKPPGEGTGLGLAIVNTLVLDHGGSMSFKSSEIKGTIVTISLPYL